MQTARGNSFKGDSDEVSRFIWCVRQRPALYNYKLPPRARRRADVAKGWREVADEIGGKLTAEDCRKKWKNLRDTYHQYRLRKSKFKDCLERWRHTKDLSFLTDIYQPKLKSQRSTYDSEHSPSNNTLYRVDEVKISSIASMIDVDENTSTPVEKNNEDTLTENDYDETFDNVVDLDTVQFCDVEAVGDMNTIKTVDGEEDYSEVCLYEENQSNLVAVDALEESNHSDRKYDNHNVRIISNSKAERQKRVNLTIGDDKDELDLFFKFLKTKIQKLPAADITAIQIEFLNAVLRKESAAAQNSQI